MFGADADKFNPDRWLKGDVGEMRESSPELIRNYALKLCITDRCFMAFGGGARLCIGKSKWHVSFLAQNARVDLEKTLAGWKCPRSVISRLSCFEYVH